MNLIHYASAPVTLEVRRPEQALALKPSGLWVSDGTAWLDWCTSEEFRTNLDWYAHPVTTTGDSNILSLESATDLDAFTAEYGARITPTSPSSYIEWVRVADVYDGILISPYQWSRRLESHTFWYYGWDCASGCIWNTEVVSLGDASRVDLPEVVR